MINFLLIRFVEFCDNEREEEPQLLPHGQAHRYRAPRAGTRLNYCCAGSYQQVPYQDFFTQYSKPQKNINNGEIEKHYNISKFIQNNFGCHYLYY